MRLLERNVGPAAGKEGDVSDARHALGERERERKQRGEEWNLLLSGLRPRQQGGEKGAKRTQKECLKASKIAAGRSHIYESSIGTCAREVGRVMKCSMPSL